MNTEKKEYKEVNVVVIKYDDVDIICGSTDADVDNDRTFWD